MSDTLNMFNSAITQSTQTCIAPADASNAISVNGTGDIVNTTNQAVQVVISSSCAKTQLNASSNTTNISDMMKSALSSEQQDMVGFLDDSNQSASSDITNNISTVVKSTSTQNCLQNAFGSNGITINGNDDKVLNTVQKATVNSVATCMSNDQLSSTTMTTVANTSNQTASFKSDGTMSEIAEMIEAIAVSMVAVTVIVFILVIVAVIIWHIHKKSKLSSSVVDLQSQIAIKRKEKAEKDKIAAEKAQLKALN